MATLIVKRSSEWANRLRNLQLHLDGKPLGEIANGESKTFTIPAGQHIFKSTIDWAGSPEITLNIQENETRTVEVKSFSGAKWLMYSAIISSPLFILLLLFPSLSAAYPVWNYTYLLLMLPPFVLMMYKITAGRKSYLQLQVS